MTLDGPPRWYEYAMSAPGPPGPANPGPPRPSSQPPRPFTGAAGPPVAGPASPPFAAPGPPSPGSRRSAVVVAALGGLAIGAAAVGIPWLITSSGSSDSSAEGDAVAACEIWTQDVDLDLLKDPSDLDKSEVLAQANRLGAAKLLAAAAHEQGAEYGPLARSLDKLYKSYVLVRRPDAETGPAADEVDEICADLG